MLYRSNALDVFVHRHCDLARRHSQSGAMRAIRTGQGVFPVEVVRSAAMGLLLHAQLTKSASTTDLQRPHESPFKNPSEKNFFTLCGGVCVVVGGGGCAACAGYLIYTLASTFFHTSAADLNACILHSLLCVLIEF